MTDIGTQTAYWNTIGASKTFTHPVEHTWLAQVDRRARILDYGCGYGRLVAELTDCGFTGVRGVDISAALIERARRDRPELRFDVLTDPPSVDVPSAGVDMVLLFAVLTCVPADDAQRELVRELARVLAPGGLLYISDLLLADDDRNQRRYAEYRGERPFGTFTTDDGATCRHHEPEHLVGLLADFDLLEQRRFSATTMNGHQAPGLQILARRRSL